MIDKIKKYKAFEGNVKFFSLFKKKKSRLNIFINKAEIDSELV